MGRRREEERIIGQPSRGISGKWCNHLVNGCWPADCLFVSVAPSTPVRDWSWMSWRRAMPSMTGPELLKTDALGRGGHRRPSGRKSWTGLKGAGGAEFTALAEIKYSMLAPWVQEHQEASKVDPARRSHQDAYPLQPESRPALCITSAKSRSSASAMRSRVSRPGTLISRST